MTVNDLPQELLGRIRSEFESSPPVLKLRIAQRDLQQRGLFKEALELAKQIDSSFNNVVYKYMAENERVIEKVDILGLPLSDEDRDKILTLGVAMFMACDLIDFAVMDMDDILRKYDKELRFDMFNDIREISGFAKQKLKWFKENSEYMKDAVWAERCDDMYEMMKNKAGSIVRKNKLLNLTFGFNK